MKDLVMNNIPQILIGLVIATILFFVVKTILWHMKYEYKYSQEIQIKGSVLSKRYVPSRTEMYTMIGVNGKMQTNWRTIPAKHYVTISSKLGENRYNRRSLYDKLTEGAEIKIVYVERYIVEKERPMSTKKFDTNIIRAIIPKIGQRLEL